MPNKYEMIRIIRMVKKIKPYFILNIGGDNVTADICGKMIPEASLNLVFSTLPTTTGTFSILGRPLNEEERNDPSLIESNFTFELNPQRNTFHRQDFNLPSDKFLLVVVGIRLDHDVDKDFLAMLERTYPYNCHVVFAGYFRQYEDYCQSQPTLKENSTFIGYCSDMLALMEICDLYVNPLRLGGGFSIIEAFHKGKPGVTIGTGDVSVAAGSEFWVRDYVEMFETIKRYVVDEEFYSTMSVKALAREKTMTDSKNALQDVVNKIVQSPLFF